jgi:hypothetical protein
MNFFDISSDQAIPGGSGSTHRFDPEVPSPLPLSFDTVNEHRPLSTSSQSSNLFRLPVELLTYIVQLIPSSSLANFALLNRDCRQLARSRQFTRVRFDYSLRSLDLLRTLIQEAFDRPQKNGLTASPSLGACIRYVKVGILGEHVEARHAVSLDQSFFDRDELERERMLIEANDSFYRTYIPFVRIAIVNALPNLQILEWEDNIFVSRSFFSNLIKSPIQHLKLRIAVNKEFELDTEALRPNGHWPLRTLCLDLRSFNPPLESVPTTLILYSILRACAPTLQDLSWARYLMFSPAGPEDKQLLRLIGDIYFPKLRRLKFFGLSPSDFSLFDKTLRSEEGCNIHILETNSNQQLEKRGLLTSLDTLIWSWYDPEAKLDFDFLKSNPQLIRLSIPSPQRRMHMMRIVSLLSRSFSRLRSLRLTWNDTFIPGDELRLIGTITSLEQICLSAGEVFGWRHSFQIDHGAIRHNLASLSNLRRIAFDRDTYDTSAENPGDYYNTPGRLHHPGFSELWERNHKDKVVTEAKKYMQIFPELEWLYIGQLPMKISRHAAESLIVLSERDESSALLDRLFGYAGKIFVD